MVIELIKQAPALAGVIIVIFLFMRHISKLSENFKVIWDEFKELHRDSMQTIKENTKATAETSEVLRRLLHKQGSRSL